MKNYDVIIIGAGLSGSSAAAMLSEYKISVLIINISMDNPAYLKYAPVFPAEKEGIIKEIENYNKFVVQNIKKTSFFKTFKKECAKDLNVVDRRRFSLSFKFFLESQDYIDTRQGLVTELKKDEIEENYSVILNDGSKFTAKNIIIACGTFLNSKVSYGDYAVKAGRHGEICSESLYNNLLKYGIMFKNYKSFVGPRVDGKGIDKGKIKEISGKRVNVNSFKSKKSLNVLCSYLKRGLSNYERKNLINNFDDYSSFNNLIENKINSLQFSNGKINFILYPESSQSEEYYIDNFCSVLNENFQEAIINSISGLESVVMTRPAYTIEYSGLLPGQLKNNMESKDTKSIFFIGEINSPCDYETAISQSILAASGIINRFYNKPLIKFKKNSKINVSRETL